MKEFYISQNWWQFLILAVASYFIGCFNFARLISRFKKRDITKIGSGNPGTMNMSREFGLKVGVITFLCDAVKGGVPALISYFIYRKYAFAGTNMHVADFTRYLCGLCVIIGHIFPATMKFKGGKGIASTLGLFWFCLPCDWPWFAPVIFVCLWGIVLFIFLTEWGSLGSLLGVTGFSIIQMIVFITRYPAGDILQNGASAYSPYLIIVYMMIIAINLLTWIAHRQNLLRLFAGEEHRTSIRKLAKKKQK